MPLLFTSLVICSILVLNGCSPKTYNLSTSVAPNGGGTISPSGGPFQGKVTLVATPAQYYVFSGWAGAVSGNTNPLTVTMNSDKQIVAQFKRITYNLQAQPDSTNGGTVQPSSGTFEAGTSETITAIPANGYRFNHWQGGATGSSNPLKIVLTSNITLTAYFTKAYKLTTSCSPNGDGNDSPGNGLYDAGTVQSITASTTLFPYAFDHWSGTDNINTNPTTVTMSADKSVTAYFKQLSPGTKQTTSSQYSEGGPATIVNLKLTAGQWVQGELSDHMSGEAQIVDSNNRVIKDFGSIYDTNFTFQAPSNGTYSFKIKTNSILFDNYTLIYTIYS